MLLYICRHWRGMILSSSFLCPLAERRVVKGSGRRCLTLSPIFSARPAFLEPWLACHMKRLATSTQVRSFSNVTTRPPGGSAWAIRSAE